MLAIISFYCFWVLCAALTLEMAFIFSSGLSFILPKALGDLGTGDPEK